MHRITRFKCFQECLYQILSTLWTKLWTIVINIALYIDLVNLNFATILWSQKGIKYCLVFYLRFEIGNKNIFLVKINFFLWLILIITIQSVLPHTKSTVLRNYYIMKGHFIQFIRRIADLHT